MVSLGLLLLGTALIHVAQTLPAGRGGGRGLDVSVDGVRRQRRDLRNLLPYENQMMSYPALQAGGRGSDLYYQSDGIDQALQRLVERDQRREQREGQREAYLAALLRLLSEAESTGLVGPADVEVVEEEDEEDDREPPADFRGPNVVDYDESEQGLTMGRPPAAWWSLVEPQLAQALLDRMDPQLVQSQLQRAGETSRLPSGPRQEQDMLRQMVAKILTSIGPNEAPPLIPSGRRARRDLSNIRADPAGSTHRRTRRSLDDISPQSLANNPPLLRVKRVEDEEEEKLHLQAAGLKRMKRIDTMLKPIHTEELTHGSRRRHRRAVLNYDPQILIDQILMYMKE
uniref:Proprotein convertase subtilisin/kexin type 1 inhibitor, like n=1 Tax=Iconisemion striatum TaxID=60296 RepID=A0A1A7YYA3_9TELE